MRHVKHRRPGSTTEVLRSRTIRNWKLITGPEYGFSIKNQIQLERKEDMTRRGLACRDLDDFLAMTFAVDIVFRTQLQSQLVYTFPSQKAWVGTKSSDPHQTQNCFVKKWHIYLLAVSAPVPESNTIPAHDH
jgi:hypothetical protein